MSNFFLKSKIIQLCIIITTVILLLTGCTTSGSNSSSKLNTSTFFAMDTIFSITLPENEAGVSDDVQKLAEKLHSLYNFHNEESDVSKINNNPNTYINVDQLTYDLLATSVKIAEDTDGFFDPTVGSLVELWDINKKVVPNAEEVEKALSYVDYKSLKFKDAEKAVMLDKAGTKVNLGAIAKGFAVKKELEILAENNISSALISAGGCNYALGTKPDGSTWKLGIQHPRENGKVIGYVELTNKTIDTSGDYERFFMGDDGVRYHHIIDLKTGYPAKGIISSTVVTTDPVKADALATALVTMGIEKAKEYVMNDNELDVVLVTEDMNVFVSDGLKDNFHPEEGIKVEYIN